MLLALALDIAAGGLKPVSMPLHHGSQPQLNLGALTLPWMIVLATDPQVPLATLNRYNQLVRPNICTMAPAYCANSAPATVVKPQSQTVTPGNRLLIRIFERCRQTAEGRKR